jgi:hypothetical protein
VAAFVCGEFALAWWTFAFPLSFCDSPAWAPGYLARLAGASAPAVASRGALVPAWFEAWGALSLATGAANAIGAAQAVLLLAALLAVLSYTSRGMTRAELIVLPAFVLSGLRHAVYSQTLLSESLAIALAIPVALFVLRERALDLPRSMLAGALAGLAAGARLENLLLLGFVAVRIALDRGPARERVRRVAAALATGLLVVGLLARWAPPPVRGAPLNESAVLAEWMRYTEPPRNALARALHFDRVDRLLAVTSRNELRNVWDALALSKAFFHAPDPPSRRELLRLMAYQIVNRPAVVLGDRLRALADLYATGHAAFWPSYREWSVYYAPYSRVFAHWTADDQEQMRTSCPEFARAQAARYERPPLRSERAHRALLALHAAAEPYARWVLRLLYWAAVPACLLAFARGARSRPLAWLGALVLSQLALRAVLTYPDERYQLPVDLLAVAWLSLALRHALGGPRAIESPAEPGDAPRAGLPGRRS